MSKFKIDSILEILTQTPTTLRAMLGGLSNELADQKPDSNSWSAFDILGHLIHGEETDWIPRARIILNQGENIRFEPFDRFAQFELSKGKSTGELLDRFAELRRENLALLNGFELCPEKLNLKGIHPELGDINLSELISTWAVHDLNHLAQIAKTLAANFRQDVGPWKQYLSILN